jgi:hypothetical protein
LGDEKVSVMVAAKVLPKGDEMEVAREHEWGVSWGY